MPPFALTLDSLAHSILRPRLHLGLHAIDATAGNGHDTVFLAQCAGPTGRVWAFDVQKTALEAAQALYQSHAEMQSAAYANLNNSGARSANDTIPSSFSPCAAENSLGMAPVFFVHAGHQDWQEHISSDIYFNAALFNLGYLPGSDKNIITQAHTTLHALQSLLPRMAKGGLISVHMYTGHPGGEEESTAILHFVQQLSYGEWSVFHTSTANKKVRREHLVLLERRL